MTGTISAQMTLTENNPAEQDRKEKKKKKKEQIKSTRPTMINISERGAATEKDKEISGSNPSLRHRVYL